MFFKRFVAIKIAVFRLKQDQLKFYFLAVFLAGFLAAFFGVFLLFGFFDGVFLAGFFAAFFGVFLVAVFFLAAVLAAGFFAAGFLAGAFFAAGFLAAGFLGLAGAAFLTSLKEPDAPVPFGWESVPLATPRLMEMFGWRG